ncbi:MAG: hypothetical protein HCA25_00495 (plasmid) [Dolichospermum sp. DET50]|nr:hypothetical protein [Dolichospermum sp. DET66]MBS3035981.1 hypothetical protein [Dolichospermum sp. DET67]MBS3041149.1 hypothetical protein [Dolichospermum sp. DET50]QSX70890.1 MAG: hypothetical protein EZY12_27220 [Dolichospermum sp. DET69]
MSEKTRQELENLSNKELKEILSPLIFLIKQLPEEVEICKSMDMDVDSKKKELYDNFIEKIVLDLTKAITNYLTVKNHIRSTQKHYIIKAYQGACDIDNFSNKMTVLLEDLMNRTKLEKLFIG